MNRRNTIL